MDFSKLTEKINIAIKDMDIFVDCISFKKKGKYSFLEVILDKVGGIDIDEIVTATHIINPIVDKYCDIDDSYILDISSKERGN